MAATFEAEKQHAEAEPAAGDRAESSLQDGRGSLHGLDGADVLEGQHRDDQEGGDDPGQAAGEAEDAPQDPEPVLQEP